jgi:phospholipid/cholesterol/gamma-HCH transport system permease protein
VSTGADSILTRVVNGLAQFGELAHFSGRTFRWMLAAAPPGRALLRQMHEVAVQSVPVVLITGAFVGMVLAAEGFGELAKWGLKNRIGSIVNISMVKELGPVLAAVMLAGRLGSAMAAELGTMRVTEQIDALTAMGADPIRHLVVPRVMACTIYIPVLTVIADFCGVLGGYFVSVRAMGANEYYYWHFSVGFVEPWDILCGVWKALLFGMAISLISCYKGFHCKPGAEGVGRAATEAFVFSFVAILVIDFILVILFQNLYVLFYGEQV